MDISVSFPPQRIPFKSKGKEWRKNCIEGKYVVYEHRNTVTGFVYVGITMHCDNPNKRWQGGNGYKGMYKISNAIRKYGWDNFEHQYIIVDSRERACAFERELIAYYKKMGISYNIANGGDGVEAMAEETIEKLKQYTPWIKGRHHTMAARKKISDAGKGRKMTEYCKERLKEANHLRPHIVTDETRKKISRNSPYAKPVLQIDKKTGEVIAEFHSAAAAERAFGKIGSLCGHITEVCMGREKRKSCYGYKWRFKE